MMPLDAVLRVVKVFPQVQVTSVRRYSGWMSFFMVSFRAAGSPAVARTRRRRGVNRNQGAIVPPATTPRPIAMFPTHDCLVAGDVARGRLLHLHQELDVRLALPQPLQQQLEGLLAVESGEHATQLPDDLELLLAHQELLAAGAALDRVDGGEQALVGEVAAETDLHVAGAL